jgi:molybdate transport system ATP-binding protein
MRQLLFDCRHRYSTGFQLEAAFEAGEGVTALFGPSGAGKTTIFALVAGLLRPQTGRILLGDRTLVDTAAGVVLPPERRQVGVVFQDHLLFPHLTVRQNLTFGLRRGGRGIDLGRVVEILEIGPWLERRPGTLSGGQRQRVALGRALLHGPQLLLMDEPLSALDESLKERILVYLERALAEWRLPTLLVSHDQAVVRRLADQVVILEAGKVVAAGPTAATLDSVLLTRSKQRPILVNLLRIDRVRRIDTHWQGQLGDQVVHLPASAAPGGERVYIQFLPTDVTLAAQWSGGLSARIRLQGVVRELVTLPEQTFVAVDVGQFLWAEVTPEAVREMNLHPGQPITCLIKSTAISVVA